MIKIISYLKKALLIPLIIASSACAQESSLPSKDLDKVYSKLLKDNKVVGASIAIVHNDEVVYANGFGYADKENEIKANKNTVYRIASMTKSFTATSIMQLHEKGLLNLNHPIKDVIPELTIENRFNEENQFLIQDILAHTSGLPSDIYNGFLVEDTPDFSWLIKQVNKQTSISPTNFKEAYSNIGYSLLGEVIARKSNQQYDAYLQKNIFSPLQMTSSFVKTSGDKGLQISKGYVGGNEFDEPPLRDAAAGMISSNVLDIANFIKMLLNQGDYNGNQIISKESLQKMQENQLVNVYLPDNTNEGYGYGLMLKKVSISDDGEKTIGSIIGHNGGTIAFNSDFRFIPELNLGAVILTNSETGAAINNASEVLKTYAENILNITLDFENNPVNEIKNKTEQFCSEDEIKGYYNFAGLIMNVNEKNKKKIKIKQGPATITLSKTKKEGLFNVKAKLFGLLPIDELDGAQVKFVKINNSIFVKMLDNNINIEGYAGNKIVPTSISKSWKNSFGNYKVTQNGIFCDTCPDAFKFHDTSLTLKEENGFVSMVVEGKAIDGEEKVYLNVLNDELAVTHGIGRETGITIRILENGNIYYHGFEFEKK